MKAVALSLTTLASLAVLLASSASCGISGPREPLTPGSATILPSPVNGEAVPKGPHVASSKETPPSAPTQAVTAVTATATSSAKLAPTTSIAPTTSKPKPYDPVF